MPEVSTECVAIVAVGVALAGLVQVRFSGLESQFSGLEKQVLSMREDVSGLSERLNGVERIRTAGFGYARKSESSGRPEDSRVAEIIPPS